MRLSLRFECILVVHRSKSESEVAHDVATMNCRVSIAVRSISVQIRQLTSPFDIILSEVDADMRGESIGRLDRSQS